MKFLVLLMLLVVYFSLTENISAQEEPFSGRDRLSVVLKATGGFNGKIFLQDLPGPGNSTHEERMLSILVQSIPKRNILTFTGVEGTPQGIEVRDADWASGHYEQEMRKNLVRVIHAPTRWHHYARPSARRAMLSALKNQDILAVHSGGNLSGLPHPDIYHPNDPYWGNIPGEGRARRSEYSEFRKLFQSGHAIMANYAIKKPETFEEFTEWALSKRSEEDLREMYQAAKGVYIRHPLHARFGSLKRHGFTVTTQRKVFTYFGYEGKIYTPGTSSASAQVAVFAFYLRQLWDTTTEVLEVMQKTAIDIGEPGVDEEFGWGLMNANHPIIWDRAMKRLEESLELCLSEDVALEEAVPVAREGLDVFHDIGNGKREIGFIFTKNKTKVAFATGSTVSPFGLSSKFLQQQSTVAQIGIAYAITDNIAVSGIYGRSGHEDADFNKGSIGINYQKHFSDSSGTLSLYAGHRSVWGSLGLPGYKAFNIAQTPFALRMVEARASFAWIF